MLLVAFSRWRVERCFEDQKSEIGLDQYEGRRYQGLKRHLILSCVSYLFLSRMRQEFGGEKSGVDGVPDPHRSGGVDPVLVVEPVAARRRCWSGPRPRSPGAARNAAARKSHTKRTRQKLRAEASNSPGCPAANGIRPSAVVLGWQTLLEVGT